MSTPAQELDAKNSNNVDRPIHKKVTILIYVLIILYEVTWTFAVPTQNIEEKNLCLLLFQKIEQTYWQIVWKP